ncbi:hypothetical protein J6590_084899, partial [Homalodisca vitripennis]
FCGSPNAGIESCLSEEIKKYRRRRSHIPDAALRGSYVRSERAIVFELDTAGPMREHRGDPSEGGGNGTIKTASLYNIIFGRLWVIIVKVDDNVRAVFQNSFRERF